MEILSRWTSFANAGAIGDFSDAENSVLFKFKQKITGITADDGIKMLK